MIAEQQLQIDFPSFTNGRRVGLHHHVGTDRQHAGRLQCTGTCIHHAKAACTDLVNIFQVAQRRDFNARLLGRFQHGCPRRNFYLYAVNR